MRQRLSLNGSTLVVPATRMPESLIGMLYTASALLSVIGLFVVPRAIRKIGTRAVIALTKAQLNRLAAGKAPARKLWTAELGDAALFDAYSEQLGGEILELCVEVGGAITGEHGVGFEKINQMCSQFAKDELVQFHALKAAFDPKGLLNPGKAVPTLARCAEYGAMRVSHGELPFPELERF